MGKLVRALSEDGGIVCIALDSTDIVAQAERIHQTSAVVTAALGRLLTAASIMGSMLKSEDNSITLRVAGDGPVGALIAVTDGVGNVRGYPVNPVVELPLNGYGKLDVGGAVGQGVLHVIKDLGLKDPYVGQVPLVSGEIAEDITSYYAVSEQIPTVCGLGVLVNTDLTVLSAGGYLIQLLPGVGEETITRLEANVDKLPPVSQMLHEGMTPQQIIEKALDGFSPNILDETEVSYRCDCSRERVERALLSLGREELGKIAEEEKVTEVGCHFCSKKYRFNRQEIRQLMERAKK
ncbi:Hsp33 family molecular chaperone HslO [Zongyangia hominis]|uniref:33 kDa chaperonin n=1 Tax=Zongyangia hominis TaxID=2763677 RepID=A0A926EC73_9FIRM|nr:Hsp33 family molecular chaperone HslO [Zongyangia hominis]MBC8569559.1 Hsp33 family molecular chaperone HslO [Zongyangia hominis]